MIHTGISREAENASAASNVNKLSASAQKPRLKTKALGDVQNTLHSRFVNFVNSNTGSAVKAPSKSSFHSKPITNERGASGKDTPSGKKINVTPSKSAVKMFVSTPTADDEIFDIHNHFLCEQDHQIYLNNFFKEYKLSDEHINRLVCAVKSFATPISFEEFEPCEDIEIPDEKNFNEDSFSVNDILSYVINLPVPAPDDLI